MDKPKLTILKDTPVKVRLSFDDFRSGENSYGKWFLYAVTSGGEMYSWFVNENLHGLIQSRGFTQGSEFEVEMRTMGDKTQYFINGETYGDAPTAPQPATDPGAPVKDVLLSDLLQTIKSSAEAALRIVSDGQIPF